jgi:hypothetical protein
VSLVIGWERKARLKSANRGTISALSLASAFAKYLRLRSAILSLTKVKPDIWQRADVSVCNRGEILYIIRTALFWTACKVLMVTSGSLGAVNAE